MRSSCGIPFEPGASVGRGDIPAVAIRDIGVGMGPTHGIAPGMAIAISKSSDAQKSAMGVDMVVEAQQGVR